MDERLVIEITAEIAELKRQVAAAKAEVQEVANESKKASTDIDDSFKKAGESIKNGMKVAAVGIGATVAALVALGPATEEFRQNQAQLNAAFEQAGFTSKSAADTYKELYKVIGDDDQAVESAANIAMLADSEEEAAKWAELASGVLGTFHDTLQPEAFYEAANETLKLGEATGAFAQMLEQTGVMSVEEFNSELAKCRTEAEKQALMLKVSGDAMNDAGASYDKATKSIQEQREAQVKLNKSMASVGEALAPVMTMLTELAAEVLTALEPYIQEFAENYLPVIRDVLGEVGTKLSEALAWIKEHQTVLTVIAGAIAAVVAAIGLYNAVAAVKVAMDAAQVASLGALIAAQAASAAATIAALAPYLLIVAAIAAVIAIIVLCIKNWDKIKETVVKVAKAIADKVTEMVSKVKAKFEEMQKNMSDKVENAKKAVSDKFESIKTAITTKANDAKTAVVNKFEEIKKNVSDKIEATKKAATDKFDAIKTAITDKITATKNTIATTFDTIKTNITDKINAAKTAVDSVFDKIKSGITNKINAARDAVKTAIEKIKGFMDFKWSLPKLKMPTIKIKGEFSLNPPSVPKFSISWNAKGGVFDDPTLFWGNGGLQGLGENGAEAVVPLEKNTEWMNVLAEKLSQRMSGGTTPIVLQVDGKTFAQTSIDSINQLTRQRGTLGLNLV